MKKIILLAFALMFAEGAFANSLPCMRGADIDKNGISAVQPAIVAKAIGKTGPNRQ